MSLDERLKMVNQLLKFDEINVMNNGIFNNDNRKPIYSVLINKWKYRTKTNYMRKRKNNCEINSNRFISKKLKRSVTLYTNIAEEINALYNDGYRLHSVDDLISRLGDIKKMTQMLCLNWDSKLINPLTLSAKGWSLKEPASTDPKEVTFQCVCCKEKMTLNLDFNIESHDNKYRNECYFNGRLTDSHARSCPWKFNTFNLEKEYYPNLSNILYDINFLKYNYKHAQNDTDEALEESQFQALLGIKDSTNVNVLKNIFKDIKLLDIAIGLQGYHQLDEKLFQCGHCCRCISKETILDQECNGHEIWCKYHDRSKVPTCIYNLTDLNIQNEVNSVPEDTIKDCESTLEKRLDNLKSFLYSL